MSQKFDRILFKVSGEALMGSSGFGHDFKVIERICKDIKSVHELGKEICLVVGGGNILRGASITSHVERCDADYMGMLATVMNAIALKNCLDKLGVKSVVQSAISMSPICGNFSPRKARSHLKAGKIVIFAAGIGSPFFTTDTAAALRAVEMGCDVLFKGTQVDGVYSADPRRDKNAVRFDKLSFSEVLKKDLKVMDLAAIALAKDNNLPIIVFPIGKKGAFLDIINGKGQFTIIEGS